MIKTIPQYLLQFLSIHSLFVIYVALKSLSFPESFNFIRKNYEAIDFGRSFYPEIDLFLIILVLLAYWLYFQRRAVEFLSIKPLANLVSWIFICSFVLFIYIGESLRQPLFYSLQFDIPSFTFPQYMAFALTVVVLAPISEELIFRGPLLFLFQNRGKYMFLILSSFWFVLIHGDLIFGVTFSLGLSFLTLKFKNLSIPIIAHAIWNFYVMHH